MSQRLYCHILSCTSYIYNCLVILCWFHCDEWCMCRLHMSGFSSRLFCSLCWVSFGSSKLVCWPMALFCGFGSLWWKFTVSSPRFPDTNLGLFELFVKLIQAFPGFCYNQGISLLKPFAINVSSGFEFDVESGCCCWLNLNLQTPWH